MAEEKRRIKREAVSSDTRSGRLRAAVNPHAKRPVQSEQHEGRTHEETPRRGVRK